MLCFGRPDSGLVGMRRTAPESQRCIRPSAQIVGPTWRKLTSIFNKCRGTGCGVGGSLLYRGRHQTVLDLFVTHEDIWFPDSGVLLGNNLSPASELSAAAEQSLYIRKFTPGLRLTLHASCIYHTMCNARHLSWGVCPVLAIVSMV